jgi:hypothetical protein
MSNKKSRKNNITKSMPTSMPTSMPIKKENEAMVGGNMFPTLSTTDSSLKTSKTNFWKNPFLFLHDHIMYLNSSKFFAGVVMIMLNVGSKFISIQFSKSTEEYLKLSLSKQILVFAMAWMGTRDIYTSLALTAIFVILSDHLFNEESNMCIVPHKHRILHKLVDENNDGIISDTEINSAISILEKARREKQRQEQKNAYEKFKQYDDSYSKNLSSNNSSSTNSSSTNSSTK